MVNLICDDCGRKVKVPEDYDPSGTCISCGGDFSEESEDNEEQEEAEDESFECENCKEEVKRENCIFFDDNCDETVYNIVICKKCLMKKAKIEPQIIYEEKIVEKPVIKYIDKEGKEVIKQNTNQIFNSVL